MVTIDRVETDRTDEIERSLPAAIETFGLEDIIFNGIRPAPVEDDLLKS